MFCFLINHPKLASSFEILTKTTLGHLVRFSLLIYNWAVYCILYIYAAFVHLHGLSPCSCFFLMQSHTHFYAYTYMVIFYSKSENLFGRRKEIMTNYKVLKIAKYHKVQKKAIVQLAACTAYTFPHVGLHIL